MAAFIPNRRDPEVTERALAKVRDDKQREAGDGCDGTWVAHPDLVAVARGRVRRRPRRPPEPGRPTAPRRARHRRPTCWPSTAPRRGPGTGVTEAGLRLNVDVGLRYLDAWLSGTGAAAIDNLMEDAATAEISRAQVWQWVHHGVVTRQRRRP